MRKYALPVGIVGTLRGVEVSAELVRSPVEVNRIRAAEISAPATAELLPTHAKPSPVVDWDVLPPKTVKAQVKGPALNVFTGSRACFVQARRGS